MAREADQGNGVQNSGLVPFGQSIRIDPMRPLERLRNGRSKAYDAFDSNNRTKKYIAFVADKKSLPRWRDVSIYSKLLDTSFLRLIGSGVVQWPQDGKQKFVFLYEAGIGQCLLKPGAFAKTTWRQPDIVSYFIKPMANILKEMRDCSFTHGSIRPDNIFYSGADANAPILLGDGLSVQPHSSQPPLFLTCERALAEPMGRGNGSISDDIYAFGVSLALFLRKNDELAGMSDEDIVYKKLEVGSYNTLVGNERLPATFMELLRGILHDDRTKRWTVEDIFSWLDGSRVSPQANTKRVKANRPFSFNGRKYLYADTLAMDLHKDTEAVANLIEDGQLTKWVETSLNNAQIYENYLKAIEYASSQRNDPDFVALQVSLSLYPHLPLRYQGRSFAFDGLGGLLAQAVMDGDELKFYKQVLRLNILDKALMARSPTQATLLFYMRQFDGARLALKSMRTGYGIERVLYILSPNTPCLSPMFDEFFVYNPASALRAYESLSARPGQIAFYLDAHGIAFFLLSNVSLIERCMLNLSAPDKDKQIKGNLKFLASLQKVTKTAALPNIAKVMRESLVGVYKRFKHVKLREKVQAAVEQAAQAGDLIAMSGLIDDERTLARDNFAFKRAMKEYRILQEEYNEYNRRLSQKSSYGKVNGRDTAALVAWTLSTLLTLVSVFSFLYGYEIF